MKRIYFLHGFMGTGKTHFDQQTVHFEQDYDVILMDLPGHGTSPNDAAVDYVDQAVHHVIEHMRRTGPGYLVGLSLGASLAIQVALAEPTLVDGIILTGYTPSVPAELTDVMVQQYDYFLDIEQHEPLIAAQFAALHGERWQRTMQRVLHQMTFRYPTLSAETLQGLHVPVYILNGTEQAHEVAGAELIKEAYPTAVIDLIPGAGHTANLDQPKLFNERLERILIHSNE
ncbi:alpha/beta fold hydrolase [Exiguobacterium antarcticum]|uniref:alpha/beta fold hydrolase n=1 Tax=Exiguobacterium antarcticum TaxID=132920 RepID=UPI00047EF696|nr:alpha/beta fold hydrolase [Exiguobacterium antarcticum]